MKRGEKSMSWPPPRKLHRPRKSCNGRISSNFKPFQGHKGHMRPCDELRKAGHEPHFVAAEGVGSLHWCSRRRRGAASPCRCIAKRLSDAFSDAFFEIFLFGGAYFDLIFVLIEAYSPRFKRRCGGAGGVGQSEVDPRHLDDGAALVP